MQNEIFYRLGLLVYKIRWPIIVIAILLVASCIPFLPNIATPFNTTGYVADNSASAKADKYLNQQLGFHHNRFVVLYHSDTLLATSSTFNDQIKKSLSGLKNYTPKHYVIYPSDSKKQISDDKHSAYAVIIVKQATSLDVKQLKELKSFITQPPDLTMVMGGEPIFVDALNKQTQVDLFKADYIAAPVSIATLIIVFGSIVAALVPIVLGGGGALVILTMLYFIGHYTPLSIFTLNIAILLGLCLTLDYALFIINRFRQELRNGNSVQEAIGITQATAGKAVFFSGLAVFISLSALLLFPINILFSVGVGGLCAVFVAVIGALFLLPAVLSVLRQRINYLPINFLKVDKSGASPFWRHLVTRVVNRPYTYFICIMLVLLALSYPIIHAKFGISDFRIFPKDSASLQFFNQYKTDFNQNDLMPIQIIAQVEKGKVLNKSNVGKIYDLSRTIKKNPLVSDVYSIVTTKADTTKSQYQMLYGLSSKPSGVKTLLNTTTTDQMTVLSVVSKYPQNTPQTNQLITELRQLTPPDGINLQIAGEPTINKDVLDTVYKDFPLAILWIMGFTFIILLILLRTLFLPIKAVVMTILSLCASYGVLVFVIQEGFLSNVLNFQPQGMLDISLLIIIFCALFGFSMDYEVFLLSRIQECHKKTADNKQSIIFGVEQSSRIITSAALIVIFLCASFMVADVLMIKAFGLGIAVAIFTDAFLIRSVLVPATMAIMGKWNWYLPKWLDKILPKI